MMPLSIGPFKKAMGTNFIAFSKDASFAAVYPIYGRSFFFCLIDVAANMRLSAISLFNRLQNRN